jgi:HD-like signal output (HDOD) protein/CheY-like chemotaxis protein
MAATRPTILFVDDEKSVLDGLRRTLFGQRDHWSMHFATSGLEALALMDRQPVDVVVSDMRMPGMDGAALLNEVRRRHPASARIILSGYSDREAIFRTIGPAHQYFVKPCNAQLLVEAVSRALATRSLLHSPVLLSLVAGMKTLPALPVVLMDLLEELQSAAGSAASVARIISSDVGLTAQILKLTNSGFFYSVGPVADVQAAVRLLGFETLRAVAVLAGVFVTFHKNGIDHAAVSRLETRSLEIGALARRLAEVERLDRAQIEQAGCAGMLAHVGSLLLFAERAGMMLDLGRDLDRSGGDVISAELAAFGASHAELGGALLGLWGFTDPVVEAVLFHHHPSVSPFAIVAGLSPIAAVHAAQHLIKPLPSGADPVLWMSAGLDLDYLSAIHVLDRIGPWSEIASRTRQEYEPCLPASAY